MELTLQLLCLFATCIVTKGAVIPPVKEGKTEAALIIVPGASIKGEAYRPLAQKIQEVSPLKLWVALLEGFFVDTPNPLQLSSAITQALGDLRHQGMTSDNIFLAGHSLGGVFVGQYGSSHASQLKGILLFASYLTRDVKLSSYPVPVLHISGDLDGQTRVTRIVDVFQQLEANVATNPQSKHRTPVIVMPGVSHAQFASGTMPKAVRDTDLKPEVTFAAAYATIANHTSAFLVSVLAPQVSNVAIKNTAVQDLDAAYVSTRNILQPLITVKMMDQNPQNSDSFVIQAQRVVAGLSPTVGLITDQVEDELSFLASKPSVTETGSHVLTLHTYAHLSFALNPLDISTTPSAPSELAYKMKSYEAVNATVTSLHLHVTLNASAAKVTCKDLNQLALNVALQNASLVAKRRFQTHGRPMTFLADVMHTTGLTWSVAGLSLNEDDVGMHVTSQALVTSPVAENSFLLDFAGMHYCKGLSPYRAMEWVYVDSLRTHA